MRSLPPGPVFTVHDAYACGWTTSALRNAVRQGRIVRLRRGTYAAAATSLPHLGALAAAASLPRAVISHRSAASLHGLPLLGERPRVPEATVPPRTGGNLPGLHVYRATLRPEDVVDSGAVRVTSVARTLADLGRHRPLVASVAAIDAALFRGLVTTEQIDDVLRFCRTWPRIPRARRALLLADGRAESPLETLSRIAFPELDAPTPAIQTTIFDEHGRLAGRADFYWDGPGVVGEADGRSKYTDRSVLTAEKQRQEWFEQLGLIVVRWGWDDVVHRRHALRDRLRSAFERGEARDRSGFPRLWTL